MSQEMEQKQLVTFMCSQLTEQKGIMPQQSREVKSTKNFFFFFLTKTKIPANTHSSPILFSLFPVEFQYW